MCFVYKHSIFACGDILAKVAMQVHLGVENIVIVTNNDVAELREFKLQFVRTDIVFCCDLLNNGTAVSALSL